MSEKKKTIWKKIKPLLVGAVLIWWAVMIVFLVRRTEVPQIAPLPDFNIVEMGELVSEDYYSVTFKGKKIGYQSTIKRKIPDGLLFQETSYYKLNIGGSSQEIVSEGLVTVDDKFRAKTMSFSFSGGGYETDINAVVEGDKLKVEFKTPSGRRGAVYPLEGDIYITSVIPDMLLRRGFARGSFDLPTFDPMTGSTRQYRVDVIGLDRIKRFGNDEVWDVKLIYGPLRTSLYINKNGTLLMEKTPEGFMSVREDKEVALKLDLRSEAEIDLLSEFMIPLGGAVIERPREAVRVTLRIKDLEAGLFDLDDFNQVWVPDSQFLLIDSRGIDGATSPEVLPSDTAETHDIQCHDRRMVSAAERITEKSTTDLERLEAINRHLFENINKSLAASMPNALEVLQKMRGDCNEHSVLFVALARALGIPARVNVGLLYMEGDFYYHAWTQAFAEGRWQTFDATLGQSPADAAHVKLTSGNLDQMLALLRFGDARITLVEVEYQGGKIER